MIVSREEARRLGLTRYFTGEACLHGHIAQRLASNGRCLICGRASKDKSRPTEDRSEESRRRSMKLDKKKEAAYQREYRLKNAEKLAAKSKAQYAANGEQIRKEAAVKRAHRREELAERSRKYYEANKDSVKARVKARRPLFRGRDNAISRTKKARRINATPAWADLAKIKAVYTEAADLGMHVDHIIPLRNKLVCGLHVHFNLQLLTPAENMAKHNRFDPADYEIPRKA